MQLIYFTAKRLQVVSADNSYILQLADSFNKLLGTNFTFVCCSTGENQSSKKYTVIDLKFGRLFNKFKYFYFYWPYFYFFFWTPFFLIKNKLSKNTVVFFSGDPQLSFILIVWRKILRLKYRICSDWHLFFNNRLYKYVVKNSNFLITTSNKLKTIILSHVEIEEKKIKVVAGGVNLNLYKNLSIQEAREKLNFHLDDKLIGYIGLFKTMGMEKGIKTMIESLRYLNCDYKMVFVGARGNDADEYGSFAKKNQVNNRCLFISAQPIEMVPIYEQAMDILVIPYPNTAHFKDYGFPMKIYEYMASNRPVIYSQLELLEEVIKGFGLAFTPEDPKDLAKKIITLFSNQKLYLQKSLKAYQKVQDYTWDKKAKQILDFIGES